MLFHIFYCLCWCSRIPTLAFIFLQAGSKKTFLSYINVPTALIKKLWDVAQDEQEHRNAMLDEEQGEENWEKGLFLNAKFCGNLVLAPHTCFNDCPFRFL